MSPRRLLLPAIALTLGAVAVASTQFSGATFVSASTATLSVAAANDWTPPTVSLSDPGNAVSGTTTLSATASDARSAVASVVFQYSVSGKNTWTTLCTDVTSPYTCSWATTSVADGSYDLRAIATDTAGYSAKSTLLTTRVINNAAVDLTDPGDNIAGAFSLTATYLNGIPGGVNINFEYSPNGSRWTTVPGCTTTSGAPYVSSRTCQVNYAAIASGSYDFRAVASGNGQTPTLYDVEEDVTIDNTAPTTTLSVPPGTLSGTVTLTANPNDADSGVDTVAFQYQASGSSTWTTICTDGDEPWACAFNTTSVANGSYNFRAVPTDVAGNVGTPATVSGRNLDNTAPSVTVTGPVGGNTVRGAVTLTADASSTKGVTSVRFDVRTAGSGTWTPVCTDVTAPYSCTWDSTGIVTGNEDVRAVMVDGGKVTTTSATVTVAVDNSPLHGLDVQAINNGAAGKPDNGDQLVLTYSSVVNLSTILSGWNGSAKAVTATFADKAATGSANSTYDNLTIAGTNLGTVTFPKNYVKAKKTTVFAASMVASTTTVNGLSVTVVTITLGDVTGTNTLRKVTANETMQWIPSDAVKSPSGSPCSLTPVAESGTPEQDW